MRKLLLLLALPLVGCGAMTNSVGSNLASGGRTAGDAGCGAVNVSMGGAGNGGLCLSPPCAISASTVNPNGSVSVVVTGWACNPNPAGQQPSGTPLPTTPPNAAALLKPPPQA